MVPDCCLWETGAGHTSYPLGRVGLLGWKGSAVRTQTPTGPCPGPLGARAGSKRMLRKKCTQQGRGLPPHPRCPFLCIAWFRTWQGGNEESLQWWYVNRGKLVPNREWGHLDWKSEDGEHPESPASWSPRPSSSPASVQPAVPEVPPTTSPCPRSVRATTAARTLSTGPRLWRVRAACVCSPLKIHHIHLGGWRKYYVIIRRFDRVMYEKFLAHSMWSINGSWVFLDTLEFCRLFARSELM